jgi:hypothetical protein
MRMPVAGRVGVVALIIGLASSIGSGYWLATRNCVPVDIPISLSKGHIRSGDFHLNVPGEYVAFVALDEPAGDSCPAYLPFQVRWQLSHDGSVIERSDGDLSFYFDGQDD